MANCYTTGVTFRQGKCRRLVEGVENSTGRRVVLAVYNDDGILEADKERNILRSLKDCDFVVDLIAFIGHDYEARSRWRDPNSGTMEVVYEHLDTDLDLYRRALQPGPRVAGDRLRSLFFQLLSGVAAVHEQGFYLRRDPFLAKLSDFLGAKVPHPFAQDTDLVTPPGELERDLRYQAPEQLIGSQMLTPAVDMWALATIIAEVATGDVLFKVNPNSRPREHLQTIYQ
ncbi:cell division control protein 2 homolog D-like [Argentina anserina]|uniref:cell division control protein 2 homolog D-like n=1 Tax=Argentina anserina TaxID=57926 RepID=UPI0021763B83|nr:cell division control protein 2 homolog D-like [Potentilla anserina]